MIWDNLVNTQTHRPFSKYMP